MSFMPEFEYTRPETVKELIDLLSIHGAGAMILAGGTDLMPRIKAGLEKPDLIIDIKDIKNLNYIENNEKKMRIGALTAIYDIRNNSLITEKYPVLHEAATLMASENIQLRGTLGGNILQDTRCLYLNKPETWRRSFKPCFKNGGGICNAAKGGKKCFSIYRGDMAPALISLGASVLIANKYGEEEVALESIFTGDGNSPLSLKKGDFVKEVIIPSPKKASGYEKLRIREAVDYPTINIALSMDSEYNGRLVVGSMGTRPLAYGFSSFEKLKEVPEKVYSDVSPINNMSLSSLYRKNMVKALANKLIMRVRGSL